MTMRQELAKWKDYLSTKNTELKPKFYWVKKCLDKEDFEMAKIVNIDDPETINISIDELLIKAFHGIVQINVFNKFLIFNQNDEIVMTNFIFDINSSDLVLAVNCDYTYGTEIPMTRTDWFFFSKPLRLSLINENIKENKKKAFVDFLKKLYGAE